MKLLLNKTELYNPINFLDDNPGIKKILDEPAKCFNFLLNPGFDSLEKRIYSILEDVEIFKPTAPTPEGIHELYWNGINHPLYGLSNWIRNNISRSIMCGLFINAGTETANRISNIEEIEYIQRGLNKVKKSIVENNKSLKNDSGYQLNRYYIPLKNIGNDEYEITDWCIQYSKLLLSRENIDIFAPYDRINETSNKKASLKQFLLPYSADIYDEICGMDVENRIWFEYTTGFSLSYLVYEEVATQMMMSPVNEVYSKTDKIMELIDFIHEIMQDIIQIPFYEIRLGLAKQLTPDIVRVYLTKSDEQLISKVKNCLKEIITAVNVFFNLPALRKYYIFSWRYLSNDKNNLTSIKNTKKYISERIGKLLDQSLITINKDYILQAEYHRCLWEEGYYKTLRDFHEEKIHSDYLNVNCIDRQLQYEDMIESEIDHIYRDKNDELRTEKFKNLWEDRKRGIMLNSGKISLEKVFALLHNDITLETLLATEQLP